MDLLVNIPYMDHLGKAPKFQEIQKKLWSRRCFNKWSEVISAPLGHKMIIYVYEMVWEKGIYDHLWVSHWLVD